ncbi:MAG: hypothetical protein PCFJNLEI_02039 [Verrucomicrobiae bacterium]|nr:hypothetical protein [Verrucomicrobiae bacterium]
MYLGVLLILLGIAVWVGSFPLLIAPIGFWAVMSMFYIPREEQRLRKLFGNPYDAYTKKVRRWI